MKHTNSLIHESSPYLLQHAHNPVNWYAWNESTLSKAREEDKLLLISVGYSACHWCHVMEHESFEDEEVAAIMNRHFVNIKVDREERPDIDQVYMSAVQLMTGHGGWPLNCFALPDGRPIYGGTYFRREQWMNILNNLADLFRNNRNKVEEYAAELTSGILKTELIPVAPVATETAMDTLHKSVKRWSGWMDNTEGGPQKAPKFPLPNNYLFLLRYAYYTHSQQVMDHVQLSLNKMAAGGIYDQLGGGFARYAVDDKWKVPHFEKMLYDNAQLISLYAEAYQYSKNERYRKVAEESIAFVERELSSSEGAFYSALDADSEGVEGKYYVWQQNELKALLKEDYALFADYYHVNEAGYWEDDNYILLRSNNETELVLKYGLSNQAMQQRLDACKTILLAQRDKRVRPGLDDKSLTSWNALMLKACCDAYRAFGKAEYLSRALSNARFLERHQLRGDGGLNHSYKGGQSSINGFLEDYAFTIDAFIALYQCTGEEYYLNTARSLCDYSISHFYDTHSGMFYFTSSKDAPLIARKTEISDNVMPASNSQMARNLWVLSRYFNHQEYLDKAKTMLRNIQEELKQYGSGYSNWAILQLQMNQAAEEIVIVGKTVDEKFRELQQHYLPDAIFAMSKQASVLPLLKDRYTEGKTLIYVCRNQVCQLPVQTTDEAISIWSEANKSNV